jgi:magnesium-transporting ATPase (P-type)
MVSTRNIDPRRSWFVSALFFVTSITEISAFSTAKGFIEDILTFIILYNNLIPISLIVTMEVVKFQQAQLINSDLDMYYPKTDTAALCRTSSLVEELGQIEFVFSDKTGTLTCNEMEFRCCSIAGTAYADVVDESKENTKTFDALRSFTQSVQNPFVDPASAGADPERDTVQEFMCLLAVCHTVIPEQKPDGKIAYQASSPDEAALVAGAELLGFQFHTRKPKSVFVNIHGTTQEFEILNVCEFNSTRKRMSTVVRTPDGKIKIYCKGADTVILERLAKNQPYTEKTLVHLEVCRATSSFSLVFRTDLEIDRIMPPRAFVRFVSRLGKSLRQSTASGRISMPRLPQRSTDAVKHSTRRRKLLKRTCFCLVRQRLRTNSRTACQIRSTRCRWLVSRCDGVMDSAVFMLCS